jgi:hypothetical protein
MKISALSSANGKTKLIRQKVEQELVKKSKSVKHDKKEHFLVMTKEDYLTLYSTTSH